MFFPFLRDVSEISCYFQYMCNELGRELTENRLQAAQRSVISCTSFGHILVSCRGQAWGQGGKRENKGARWGEHMWGSLLAGLWRMQSTHTSDTGLYMRGEIVRLGKLVQLISMPVLPIKGKPSRNIIQPILFSNGGGSTGRAWGQKSSLGLIINIMTQVTCIEY